MLLPLRPKGADRRCGDLEGHAVGKQHGVAVINSHAVLAHGVFNFPHNALASGLNAQAAGSLEDVIGDRLCANHSLSAHDCSQVCALNQQLIPA